MDIGDCIRKDAIKFYNKDKKLDTSLEDFGEYNWGLVRHLARQSEDALTIKGDLEQYLQDRQHLYELADFLVQLQFTHHDIKIHVDVDVKKLAEHYDVPQETGLYQPKISENQDKEGVIKVERGDKIADTKDWAPYLSEFEKRWNFSLDLSIGGMVGYPGYEHPITAEDFDNVIASHAGSFVIGTKEQLLRYKTWPAYVERRLARGVTPVREGIDDILEKFLDKK